MYGGIYRRNRFILNNHPLPAPYPPRHLRRSFPHSKILTTSLLSELSHPNIQQLQFEHDPWILAKFSVENSGPRELVGHRMQLRCRVTCVRTISSHITSSPLRKLPNPVQLVRIENT